MFLCMDIPNKKNIVLIVDGIEIIYVFMHECTLQQSTFPLLCILSKELLCFSSDAAVFPKTKPLFLPCFSFDAAVLPKTKPSVLQFFSVDAAVLPKTKPLFLFILQF